jgi:hypothetical protein
LTERRNLFVHTRGRISAQYLEVCKAHGLTLDPKLIEGGYLGTNEKYLANAYRSLYEIGLKVGQIVYRKLWPNKNKIVDADRTLLNIGYDMLVAERWDIAKMVFDFGLSLPSKLISSDADRKIFLINECIALKWNGEVQPMRKLLDSVDWSAADAKFRLAVLVLKENYKQAEAIMSSMGKREPIEEHSFRTWPLFRQFRKTIYFRRAFKKIYGKEFQFGSSPAGVPRLPAKRLRPENSGAIFAQTDKEMPLEKDTSRAQA